MSTDNPATDGPVSDAPPDSIWEPTRLSRALVGVLTLATASMLVVGTGLVVPAAVGLVGAGCLAGALWLTAQTRYDTATTLLATVVYVPVGVGLVGAVVTTVLLQYGTYFPAPTSGDVPGSTLRIAATVGVVLGATGAVLGAGAQGRAFERATLRTAARLTTRLAGVPVVLAGGIGVFRLLSSPVVPPTVDLLQLLTAGFDTLGRGLLRPPAPQAATDTLGRVLGEVAIATFVLLAVAMVVGLRRALRALPIVELAGDRTDVVREWVTQLDSLLSTARLGGLFLLPMVGLVDVGLSVNRLQTQLSPATTRLVYQVVTAESLRGVFFGVTVVTLCLWLASTLVRRAAQQEAAAVAAYAPLVAGGLVVAGAYAVGPVIVRPGIGAVAARIGGFGEPFTAVATRVTAFYGAGLVVSALLAGALSMTTVIVVGLLVATRLGVVGAATAGSTIAGVGLLMAAGFAAVLPVPLALVVIAAGMGLVVADLGRHGRLLGQEVGRRATTYRVELVRAGALGVVLVVATISTLGLAQVALGGVVTPVPAVFPLTVALGALAMFAVLLWAG